MRLFWGLVGQFFAYLSAIVSRALFIVSLLFAVPSVGMEEWTLRRGETRVLEGGTLSVVTEFAPKIAKAARDFPRIDSDDEDDIATEIRRTHDVFPQRVEDRVRKLLDSNAPSDRTFGLFLVRTLSVSGFDQQITKIVKTDSDLKNRLKGIELISYRGDSKISDEFSAIPLDKTQPLEIRRRVADALSFRNHPLTTTISKRFLDEEALFETGFRHLRHLSENGDADAKTTISRMTDRLTKILSDRSANMSLREDIANELYDSADETVQKVIRSYAKDEKASERLRRLGIARLVQTDPNEAVKIATDFYRKATLGHIKEHWLDLIGIAPIEAKQPFLEQLAKQAKETTSPDERETALEGLAYLNYPGLKTLVESMVSDSSAPVDLAKPAVAIAASQKWLTQDQIVDYLDKGLLDFALYFNHVIHLADPKVDRLLERYLEENGAGSELFKRLSANLNSPKRAELLGKILKKQQNVDDAAEAAEGNPKIAKDLHQFAPLIISQLGENFYKDYEKWRLLKHIGVEAKDLGPLLKRLDEEGYSSAHSAVLSIVAESNLAESEKIKIFKKYFGKLKDKQWNQGSMDFESVFQRLSAKGKKEMSEFIEGIVTKNDKAVTTAMACESVCHLFEDDVASLWLNLENLTKPGAKQQNLDWQAAMSSLSAFFTAKAAPYCAKANETLSKIIAKNFNAPTRKISELPQATQDSLVAKGAKEEMKLMIDALKAAGIDANALENVRSFSNHLADTTNDIHAKGASAVYAKLYYASFLRELLTQNKLPQLKSMLESELERIDESHASNLLNFAQLENGLGGSLYSTYLFSASMATLPASPKEATDRVRKIYEGLKQISVRDKDPNLICAVPYEPHFRQGEGYTLSPRGAAGRAVVFYRAAIKNAPDEKSKMEYKSALKMCLKNLENNLASLRVHQDRGETHHRGAETFSRRDLEVGKLQLDAMAPYFFLPSAAYAIDAYQDLLKDKSLTKEERAALEAGRAKVESAVYARRTPAGTFKSYDEETYASSSIYVNPLSGLALLPRCAEERSNSPKEQIALVAPTKTRSSSEETGHQPKLPPRPMKTDR